MLPQTVRRVYLQPGELHLAGEPAVVSTVLGSCVALTIWDPVSHSAAVSHCVLPGCGRPGEERAPGRYVRCCVPRMLSWFDRRKIQRDRLKIQLIGGATGLFQPGATVGEQNVAAAIEAVSHAGLDIRDRFVGGRNGRKLVFHSASGEARITELRA